MVLNKKLISGPLSDIIQLFLSVIFDLLEQEAEERRETDVKITREFNFFFFIDDTL
jgi:hypothetical protein